MDSFERAINRHIGARISDRRRELGMKREALAAAAGVSPAQIGRYERGAVTLFPPRLLALAGRLGVEVGFFFEGLDPAMKRPATVAERPAATR
jgi:transcriptional regulator with XRE-family HTH domain